MRLLEVKHGLLQIAETLDFLHNNARLIHRSIAPEVIFSSFHFVFFSQYHTWHFAFLFVLSKRAFFCFWGVGGRRILFSVPLFGGIMGKDMYPF